MTVLRERLDAVKQNVIEGCKNAVAEFKEKAIACALSKMDKLVGLISSNLTYGELQTFFGQSVPTEKGIFEALSEESPNIGERFAEYTESKNLFFLSVPTPYTGLLSDRHW